MSPFKQRRPADALAGLEVLTVFALILAYIWWLRFRLPYSWLAILALVCGSHVLRRESLTRLGFKWIGPVRRFAQPFALLALVAVALMAIGVAFRTLRDVTWQGAVSSLGLYLAWGFFQQYLLNGYFVNRFTNYLGDPARAPIHAAIFFSVAHMPNWFLMLVTFIGGYVCARIYLKYRNLYFLGLAHGVVGFLIYLVAPDSVSHHLYVGPKWFSA